MNVSREKVEADAARVDALRAAGSDGLASKVPDGNHGNHGDNLQTTQIGSTLRRYEEAAS
jgi:hypothetical protein